MADDSAVERLLVRSRAAIDRVEPDDLAVEVQDGAVVVDVRPEHDRRADGAMPGAVVVERIHLEWRLDPTSEHRLPGISRDTRVILVCNEGYASSLAAATLRALGARRATDLVGGYRAWRALHPDTTG